MEISNPYDPRDGFIKAGEALIPVWTIKSIDISLIEKEMVSIKTDDGVIYRAWGFDAIEAVMLVKPSALEGRRLKWRSNAWAFHNFIAHPVMQIMVWLGMKKRAIKFHDKTTPRPRNGGK